MAKSGDTGETLQSLPRGTSMGGGSMGLLP